MADKEKKGVFHKCHLCEAQFTDKKEKDTHYNGQFHKFMMGVRRTQLLYMGQSKTLNDQITETGKKESLIGLEYIYEYAEDSQGVRMYECKLCSSAFRVASIFFHIVGIRHRVLYLAKHHPIMGIEDNFEVQQQVHYRKLTNHALAIEQTHGRKKINVVEEVYVSKPNVSEFSDMEIYLVDNIPSKKQAAKKKDRKEEKKDVNRKNSRLRRGRDRAVKYRELLKSREQDDDRDDRSRRRDRDSSSSRRDRKEVPKSLIHDDDFDARNISQGSSSASRLNLLKDFSAADSRLDRRKRSRSPDRRSRAHNSHRSILLESSGDIDVRSVLPAGGISFRELKAANIGHLHGGFSSLHLPLCKKKKKTDKDSDSDMEVCSMDFSECEPDDFWCNEELFDYLKCYHVGDEEDVQFILDAIKTLSHALVRHKTRKEDLKNWIAMEKQKLEDEKKIFQEMKKRKEDKITSTKINEPEMLKMFNEVTGSDRKHSFNTGKDAQAATQKTSEKVNQLTQLPNIMNPLVAGIPPVVPPATQRSPAVTAPQLVPGSQKTLVTGKAPVQQAAQKPSARKVTPAQQTPISQKALTAGVGQLLQQLFLRPLAPANPPNPTPSPQFNIRGPVGGTRPALGAASTTPTQNPQIPGLKFDNPNPSKEQRPFPGQGAGRDPAPANPPNTTPSPQFNIRGPVGGTRPALGAASTTPSQNPQISGLKFDNPKPSKGQRPFPGQGAGRYPAENVVPSHPVPGYQQLPGSNTAPVQQAGPRASAPMNSSQPQQQAAPNLQGSEMHFSQNLQNPGPRFDNSNPGNQAKSFKGQAASRYQESDSSYSQDDAYPGAWSENSGSLNKTRPPVGADQKGNYKQTAWNSGPTSGNQGFYKEGQPATRMETGRYDDQYTQNQWQSKYSNIEQYGAGIDNKPPDQKGNYKQTAWNSGPTSGNQGFYKEGQPATRMETGRYDDQYTQNQWQSKYSSIEQYGAGIDNKPPGPQGLQPQPPASTGYSSEGNPGKWPSAAAVKRGTYPAGILKNKIVNPP